MQRILTAIAATALAGAIAVPAKATTFPGLTLIYFVSGAVDKNTDPKVGTTVPCTNLSANSATVRWIFFNQVGEVRGSATLTLASGATSIAATANDSLMYGEEIVQAAAGFQGQVRVYSTQSAVFCSALIASTDNSDPGNALHMVRFNANPGTDE